MCECLGCSGCAKKGRCPGRCGESLGRYYAEKRASRCHWCFPEVTSAPIVTSAPDATSLPLPHFAEANVTVTSAPIVTVTLPPPVPPPVPPPPRVPPPLYQLPQFPKHKQHFWSTPLKVSLFTDSVGRLKSRAKDYVKEVQSIVASQSNIVLTATICTGEDLPDMVRRLEEAGPSDVILIISMSNYAADTVGQSVILDDVVVAVHRLQVIAESTPTYVMYGGPGEMWELVNARGQDLLNFEAKTARIRELLATSGHIEVRSGANDFRTFFKSSDLDYMGHVRGVARDKAIEWLAKQVKDVSYDLFQRLHMPQGLRPVDPLAAKRAIVKFEPLEQVWISAYFLRPLSHDTPNVFLLSGPDSRCKAQQVAACNMFTKLGFAPRLVFGITRDVELPHPRSHWAWALAFIPKLLQIVAASNCSDDEVVLIGEDSCWPTEVCTPQHVRNLMQEALGRGCQGIWLGACGGMRNRKFDMAVNLHGRREERPCEVARAPCGSKLFAFTIRELRLLEHVWGWVPQEWFVDGVHQLLAASGHILVNDFFLAASMAHYSMRHGSESGVGDNIRLSGPLLPEGRLEVLEVQHCTVSSSSIIDVIEEC